MAVGTRTPWRTLCAVLAAGVALAGCGGDSDVVAKNQPVPVQPVVVVLGGSLNADLAPGLRAALGATVFDETSPAIAVGEEELYDWRQDWAAAVRSAQPDLVVVSAAVLDPSPECVQVCFDPDSRAEKVAEVLSILADVPTVVWVGYPQFDRRTADALIGPNSAQVVRDVNAVDAKTVRAGGRSFVSADRILGRYRKYRVGPDGLRYEYRRSDGIHYCPLAVSAIVDAINAAADVDAAPDPGWWAGPWRSEPRYTSLSTGPPPCDVEPVRDITTTTREPEASEGTAQS